MGDLLEGHPALDELIRVPRRWWKSPREMWRMRQRLRELQLRHDDRPAMPHEECDHRVAERRTAANRQGGRRWPRAEPLVQQRAGRGRRTHVIEHYLSMLRPLGIESPAVRFDLPELQQTRKLAEKFFASAVWRAALCRAESGRGLAVENLAGGALRRGGATPGSRAWHAERRGVGDEATRSRWPSELSSRGARQVQMAPPTTMRELAALVSPGRAVRRFRYGADASGRGRGTPTISLHGPSRAEWCGAYGPQNIRLQVRYEDGSSLERRKADDSAMQEITSKMVTDACDQLLGTANDATCRLKYCEEDPEARRHGEIGIGV